MRNIMKKRKIILDEYEQEIEDNFENLQPLENSAEIIAMLREAAREHIKEKSQTKEQL